MASPQPLVRRPRGRPRTPGADERILLAALEEYAERGWPGFTIDAVARRAGVGKSTIYLRWRDKDALLTDAVCRRSRGVEDVDTGSLRGDLEALVVNLFRFYLVPSGWATLRLTVDAAASATPLAAVGEKLCRQRALAVEDILSRGAARGEIRLAVGVMTIVQCLYGAVATQALTLSGERRTLDATDLEVRATRLVDFVLAGAAS